jgi:hypothetical protein
MLHFVRFALGICALAASAASADETKSRLADSPDAVLVRAKCSICHSVDYIPMNSRFLNRSGWDATVRKMVKVMGAPIADDEAMRIVDYLTKNYGTEP